VEEAGSAVTAGLELNVFGKVIVIVAVPPAVVAGEVAIPACVRVSSASMPVSILFKSVGVMGSVNAHVFGEYAIICTP